MEHCHVFYSSLSISVFPSQYLITSNRLFDKSIVLRRIQYCAPFVFKLLTVFISFILFQMAFPAEDDDDLDVDALRLAALSTLKKTAAQPAHTPSSSMSTLQVSNGPRLQLKGGPRPHQNRGRGRGHNMNMNMRRGRGRGGFPNSFNPPQVK